MSDIIVRKIIENRIKNNWVLTPVDYDNLRFKPKRGQSFISVIVSENPSKPKGFKCTQRSYSLLIEVRVPKNSSLVTIDSYTGILKDLFEGYEEGNFYCLTGYSVRVGNSGQWYQKNVVLQCKYKQVN